MIGIVLAGLTGLSLLYAGVSGKYWQALTLGLSSAAMVVGLAAGKTAREALKREIISELTQNKVIYVGNEE